jgi:hypothetical protein
VSESPENQPPVAAAQPAGVPPTAPLASDALPTDTAPAWAPTDEGGGSAAVVAERPEIAVGAAFAGGFTLALILKRLAR